MKGEVPHPKPGRRMKTVAAQLARCIANECSGCYLQKESDCMRCLMYDSLWYLKMTLEKSERRNDG